MALVYRASATVLTPSYASNQSPCSIRAADVRLKEMRYASPSYRMVYAAAPDEQFWYG
jgi:hypothetical protein